MASIAMVLATVAGLWLLDHLSKIVVWLVIAGFFAVVLNPAVDFLQYRARMRRGLATLVVFMLGMAALALLLYSFIRPIVDQASEFADNFPEYVEDAQSGEGQIGRLVQRYEIDEWLEENQDRLREGLQGAGEPALNLVRSVANTVVALLTIVVLSILMLLRGPQMLQTGLMTIEDERRRERVRRVAADCARAVTGYVAGNLLISVIAGVTAYVWLWAWGVPFREVLALWVGFADLIPLVGATLGAIPLIGVAFLHSVPAGIGAIVFYVLYQQFENHVLQVTIMSRTVDLNPLAVLVSVLVGVELSGFLGALLAIPAAGVIQVIVRDLYDERKGRWKVVPTTGEDEVPIDIGDEREPEPAPVPVKKTARKTTKAAVEKSARARD